MKKSIVSILLIFIILALLISSVFARINEERAIESAQTSTQRSTRVPMKVCVEKMSYYRNEIFEGSALGSKKFGEIVYAEDAGGNVARIYNKSGNMLGYCSMFHLVTEDVRFIAEFPWRTDTATSQVSKLVDLRKYIDVFEAKVTCSDSDYVAIQYDTAIKLFRAARTIYDECGYILNVSVAHTSSCTCAEDHKTGGILTLTITKTGSNVVESIPLYADTVAINEDDTITDPSTDPSTDTTTDPDATPDSTPDRALSRIAQILADNSLIRVSETDCFADADNSSYISTVIDPSTVTYSVWE